MVQTHIVSGFDKDLGEIERQLLEMSHQVMAQIASATEALTNGDVKLAKKVRKGDKKINQMENHIDELITRLLALRQPMAEDLRKAVVSLKVNADLERLGDYAKTVANRTSVLAEVPPVVSAMHTVNRMSIIVQAMLGEVMEAYLEQDLTKAEHVRMQDDEIDQLNSALFREMLTYMMEKPAYIESSTHLLFIAKTFERAGDHITNIAEQVYFLVTGDIYEDGEIDAEERR